MSGGGNDIVFTLAGQTLQLMPERCAFWLERRVLLAADLHLGKEGTFRSAGIPLPEGPSVETLQRLAGALERTGADRLVVLGDLFHGTAAVAAAAGAMDAWRRRHGRVHVDLVAGSHDRWSGQLPTRWRIDVHGEPFELAPLSLRHYPAEGGHDRCLAGHLHPGIGLRDGRRGAAVRLPCFYFSGAGGLLPAFGSFTGLTMVEPGPGDHCFAVAGDRVVTVPTGGASDGPHR